MRFGLHPLANISNAFLLLLVPNSRTLIGVLSAFHLKVKWKGLLSAANAVSGF
jgi:hypothetical protein